MEQTFLKRAAINAEKQDAALPANNNLDHAWEQQGACKRPRLDEYRESAQESDDEGVNDNDSKESNRRVANLRTPSDNEGSWSQSDSMSGLSNSEAGDTRLEGKKNRWIVRRDSMNPSISSVITEVSDSEIISTVVDQDDATCDHHHSSRKSSQPIDSVIRNMESWSVTHIRALRRNNVYENNRLAGTSANYRAVVKNAKRDVMRTLRRESGVNSIESGSKCDLKHDAVYSSLKDNIAWHDRCPSPMDEL